MRGAHTLCHQLIEPLNEVCHIAAPYRLRSPRDLEALPREDVFKPVQRKKIPIFARYDIGQQAWTGKPLVDSRLRPFRRLDAGVFAVPLAACAGILLAHMLDAFEVAWQILDLPAFLGADLLARQAAARARPLCFAQLVDMRAHRKVLEVGQIAPPLAALHAT